MKLGIPQTLITLAGALGAAGLISCINPSDTSGSSDALALSQAAADSAAKHDKRDICHIPPGNPENAHTITVGNPAVMPHLAHGDKLGRCEDRKPDVAKRPCPDRAPGDSGKGHKGIAPDLQGHKAKVCHIPPGNPANAHTIIVGIAAVKAHLAHGDVLGACAVEGGETVVIDCGKGPGDHGTKGGGHVEGPGKPGDGVDTAQTLN